MSSSQDDQNEAKLEEFLKQRSEFFALIGHCVTEYQKTEDFLPRVFAAALGISETKAFNIFDLHNRLESKLAMISVALSDASDEHQERWKMLVGHIQIAAEARNQIAHGAPTQNAGHIIVEIAEGHHAIKRVTPARMELHKNAKKSKIIWTVEDLTTEYHHAHKLFGHLIAFEKRLKGESFSKHLEEPFDSPAQKGKRAKTTGTK